MEKHFLLGAHPFWNINVHELFTNWPWIDCLNTNCSGVVQELFRNSRHPSVSAWRAVRPRRWRDPLWRKVKTTGRKNNKTGVKLSAPVPHTSKACRTGAEQVLNKCWTSDEQVLNRVQINVHRCIRVINHSGSSIIPGHQTFRVRRQFRGRR